MSEVPPQARGAIALDASLRRTLGRLHPEEPNAAIGHEHCTRVDTVGASDISRESLHRDAVVGPRTRGVADPDRHHVELRPTHEVSEQTAIRKRQQGGHSRLVDDG